MKILITGGSGFIGSRIAESLQAKGHDVSVLDLNRPRVKGVSFTSGSVLEIDAVDKAVKDCDAVFHLAAMMGVWNTEQHPIATLDVNILGTRNVLESCRKNGVKKILLTSSSEYYGEPVRTPLSEDDLPRPKSAYGVTKVACEYYVRSYGTEYGLDYSLVRYFNVYGPGQSDAFVLPKFVGLALEGKPLTVYGDGGQIRCFAHVQDVVEGTLLAFFSEAGSKQTFNIGNDSEPLTMSEAATRVLKLVGSDAKPVFVPLEQTDRSSAREIYKRIPDISKARKMLGYEPKVTLDEGIQTLIDYRKKR